MFRFSALTIASSLLSVLMTSICFQLGFISPALEAIGEDLGCSTPHSKNSPIVLFVPFDQSRKTAIGIYGASEQPPFLQESFESRLHF